MVGLAVLASDHAHATGNGNNVDVACNGLPVLGSICRGTGAVCADDAFSGFNPPPAANNPQDNIKFSIPPGGATITYTLKSPNVSMHGATQHDGEGEIDPGSNTFDLNPGGSSKTLNFTAPAGSFSQQIKLDNVSGGGKRFRFVTYQITCTPLPPPPTLTIVKAVINGDGKSTFTFSMKPYIAVPPVTPPAGNASAVVGQPITLKAGTAYELTENVQQLPAGWKYSGAACAVKEGGSIGYAVPNGVKFTPGAGQDITCTLTNTKELPPPTLTLVKAVITATANRPSAFPANPLSAPFRR